MFSAKGSFLRFYQIQLEYSSSDFPCLHHTIHNCQEQHLLQGNFLSWIRPSRACLFFVIFFLRLYLLSCNLSLNTNVTLWYVYYELMLRNSLNCFNCREVNLNWYAPNLYILFSHTWKGIQVWQNVFRPYQCLELLCVNLLMKLKH